MKIKSTTILNKLDSILDAMFFSDEFIDKYAVLYDRLIKDENIKIAPYKETDNIIIEIGNNTSDLNRISKLVINLPCDYMFDLYCRYQVLYEYLENSETIEVSSYCTNKLFVELFNELWYAGIPKFSRKNL